MRSSARAGAIVVTLRYVRTPTAVAVNSTRAIIAIARRVVRFIDQADGFDALLWCSAPLRHALIASVSSARLKGLRKARTAPSLVAMVRKSGAGPSGDANADPDMTIIGSD